MTLVADPQAVADVPHPGVGPAEVAPDRAVAQATPRYRADIDGLRAVAVLSVIFVHARVPGFSGGFVGVDIFFVISGYLIYRDLVKRAAEGRLSLLGFYGRRMRRTLPALYLVGFATLAGALCVMLPSDLDSMARSLVAAVLLVPNIFFLTEAGYFDAAAGTKPLLHAWSLGVEEQFYLLAPLLPLALARLGPTARRFVLFALFVTGLGGCIALRHAAPDAAFYLMPARIFEFLIGALLVEGFVPKIRVAWLAETIAIVAIIAIGWSIARFGDATPHPGLDTLLPCLGTAAIIHVGTDRRTLVGRLLGLRGPAFIGLISYSLYLWHWPILVLTRVADVPLTPSVLVVEGLLIFALSVLSWRFVETPFRRAGSPWRARAPFLVPAAATVLAGLAVVVVALHGLPGRYPPAIASIARYYAYRDAKPFREGQCFITSKESLSDYDRATCLKIDPTKRNVLLIGDSHAAHLWTALRDTWPDVNVLQATASGCKPTLGTTGASRCTTMMDDMFRRFIPSHHLDAIVIGGLWDFDDVAPLERTIAALKPHVGRIVVFGPMPRYDAPVATLIAKAMLDKDFSTIPRHLLPEPAPLDKRMCADIAPLATYVSPFSILCGTGTCRLLAAPGVPMQFDYHHLTPRGADVMMAQVHAEDPDLFGPQRSTSSR